MNQRRRLLTSLLLLLFSGVCIAKGQTSRPLLANKYFRISLSAQTPNQMGAFYKARGFPRTAIAEIRKACFITVNVHNKSNTIVWYNLGDWRFSTPNGLLHRILRADWTKRWRQLGLAERFQSAFRQTLAPVKVDFRPSETEGGNITLPRTKLPITITGLIYVGKQKNRLYKIKFENLYCAGE